MAFTLFVRVVHNIIVYASLLHNINYDGARTFKHAYPIDILQSSRLSSAIMIHLPSGVVPPIHVAS